MHLSIGNIVRRISEPTTIGKIISVGGSEVEIHWDNGIHSFILLGPDKCEGFLELVSPLVLLGEAYNEV